MNPGFMRKPETMPTRSDLPARYALYAILSRALARGQVSRGSILTIRTTASQRKPLRSLALLLNFFDELRRKVPVGK
jgi:hypothetical protein